MMLRILRTVLLVSLALTQSAFAKYKIVTSFSILEDVVKAVSGDLCEVSNIVGPNQDTHVFQPTPATNQMVLNADMVILNGLGFEPWLLRLIEGVNYKGVVIQASHGLKPLTAFAPQSKVEKVYDPHVWNNVQNVIIWTQNVQKALQTYDPLNKKTYQTNGDAYIKKLQELDKWVKDQYKGLHPDHCKVITAHDAFSYYEDAYKVRMLAPVGLATQDEPSAFEMAELVNLIRKEKITTLFVENINNRKIIQQLAEETGVKLGEVIYSDALSLASEPASTYIKYMIYNTNMIVKSIKSCHACRP